VKLHSFRTRAVPSHFDPFLGDAGLRHAYQLLHSASWDEVTQQLEGDSWLLQSILVSDDAAIETIVFERLAQARPSGRTLALLGGALIRDAELYLRGVRLPLAQPSPARRAAAALLEEAEETLARAVRLRPALADPWIHLLSSGRLLGLDLPELRARFENAHSRAAFRPDGCRQYLLGLSARNGGTDDAMFQLARWICAEAPPDSAARLVLPMAHLERGLGPSGGSLTDHLTIPDTMAELTSALAAFLAATPPEASAAELGVLNAYGLAMTVDSPEAAGLVQECFRRIDNRPTSYPWSLYHDEEIVAVFAEVRRTQLRSAGRFL
jgi:hypothetical protein